ncbi:MAG: hypothetical protein AAB288_04855, partial [Acidobacteriota bacterium]
MLSALYLIIAVFLGELICRRFIKFDSLPHRLAADFLIGILVSTWLTYVASLAFYETANPLLYGNIIFFIIAGVSLYFGFRDRASLNFFRPGEDDDRWVSLFAAAIFVFSCWLMFGTFGVDADNLKIAAFLMNDFGPNLSLVQSFAVGHNFPTEYPHFIGEPIRYHFLFWFQAGNLEFLGLNIAWGLNLLSTLTLAAMLLLIDAFGRIVFDSKATGRIAAVLFFFHGVLSYIPFLWSKGSVGEMFSAAVGATEWLNSIYKYTGEQWGVWSMGTFLAQRHLPAAIGIFLVVLIFILQRVKQNEAIKSETQHEIDSVQTDEDPSSSATAVTLPDPRVSLSRLVPYIIAGIIHDQIVMNSIGAVIGFILCLIAFRGPVMALLAGLPAVVALIWVLGFLG